MYEFHGSTLLEAVKQAVPATFAQEASQKEREIRLLGAFAVGQRPVRGRRQFQLLPIIGKAKSCARQFHPRYGL